MTYRLIATDLDGTLLRSDGTVSPRTIDALRRAEEAGLVVVIATGRPLRWVRPVADMLRHTGVAILSNGAAIYDMHTDTIMQTRPLPRDAVLKVADAVRSALPEVTFAIESVERGFGQEPGYPTHTLDDGQRPTIATAHIEELATDDIIKLLILHNDMGPDELLTRARDVAGDLAEFTHSSRHGLLEVSASGVTKASTLAGIAAGHDIAPDDVIAFGDMPNDLPMLAWAGTGYAMANAHPIVRAATEHHAPPNDDDGVAQVVEALLRR